MMHTSSQRHTGAGGRPTPSTMAPWLLRFPFGVPGTWASTAYPRRLGCSTQRCRLVTAAVSSAQAQASKGNGLSVMIVESPAKAAKIQKFLGDSYKVLASYGHIRDLPRKSGSVLPDQDFQMVWAFTPSAMPRYQEIQEAVKGAGQVLLATDPDREGEAISWHVASVLQEHGALKGQKVARVTFNEVTKDAVARALQSPRQVSDELVDAYKARRALDYLVGFTLSPELWRLVQGARSAGRVQSVALRLVCERESEIEVFNPQEYWTVAVDFMTPSGQVISTEVTQVDGQKLGRQAITERQQAEQLVQRIKAAKFKIQGVSTSTREQQPSPPFITSTLQQEASRRLGFNAQRTMRLAQSLYEGEGAGEGLITYMRTDGVTLSPEATQGLREVVQQEYGRDYLPPQPRVYKSRAKNAQEAHEAIRPTRPDLDPDSLPPGLDPDQARLYRLIWQRAIASQMANAKIQQVGVDVGSEDGRLVLRATGSSVTFPGYLQVYNNYDKTPEEQDAAADSDQEGPSSGSSNDGAKAAALLRLKQGQGVRAEQVTPSQHFTRPPPRYTEATLVKALEELGIGRPSTYAPIMSLLQNRGYVVREGRALVPTTVGRVLVAFLTQHFPHIMDYSFTSDLEGQLDSVSSGSMEWKQVMREFWARLQEALDPVKKVSASDVFDMLDKELGPHLFPQPQPQQLLGDGTVDGAKEAQPAADPRQCPMCKTGTLRLKPSRFGGFIGCSNYDNPQIRCRYGRAINLAGAGGDSEVELGPHPVTGHMITAKMGPHGPYVQMETDGSVAAAEAAQASLLAEAESGESEDSTEASAGSRRARSKVKKTKKQSEAEKPVRVALPNGTDISTVTLEQALALLAAPSQLGVRPETGEPIVGMTGKYGPYLKAGDVSVPLPKGTTLEDITQEEAVALVEAKAARMADRIAKGLPPTGRLRKGALAAATAAKAATSAEAHDTKAPSSSRTGKEGSASRRAATPSEAAVSGTRAPSAYILFSKATRPAVVAANPTARQPEIMKLLAAMWKGLSDVERQAWQEQAASAKEGQASQQPAPSSSQRKSGSTSTSSSTSAAKASSSSSSQRSSGSSSKSKPAAKGSSALKIKASTSEGSGSSSGRGPNPYISFCTARRPAVKAANPGAAPSEIVSLLAAEWRGLSEQQKAQYAAGA